MDITLLSSMAALDTLGADLAEAGRRLDHRDVRFYLLRNRVAIACQCFGDMTVIRVNLLECSNALLGGASILVYPECGIEHFGSLRDRSSEVNPIAIVLDISLVDASRA